METFIRTVLKDSDVNLLIMVAKEVRGKFVSLFLLNKPSLT